MLGRLGETKWITQPKIICSCSQRGSHQIHLSVSLQSDPCCRVNERAEGLELKCVMKSFHARWPQAQNALASLQNSRTHTFWTSRWKGGGKLQKNKDIMGWKIFGCQQKEKRVLKDGGPEERLFSRRCRNGWMLTVHSGCWRAVGMEWTSSSATLYVIRLQPELSFLLEHKHTFNKLNTRNKYIDFIYEETFY